MNPLDFVSVKLSIALIFGIYLGWTIPFTPDMAFLLLGVGLINIVLFFLFENYRTGVGFGFASLLTTACLGVVAITLAQPNQWHHHYSHFSLAEGGIWELELKEVLKPSSYYNSYIFEVRSFNGSACNGPLLGKVEKSQGSSALSVDDKIIYYGKIRPVPASFNPYQFDYSSYMETLGIYDQIKLNSINSIQFSADQYSLKGLAAQVQQQISDVLRTSSIGAKELGIIQAILLGQRNDLDPRVYQDYKDAGAAHILAVSGLHIGILLLLVQLVLRPLRLLRHGSAVCMLLTVFILWAYAFFTGLSPSVVRAVTMFSFVTYALYLNRPTGSTNILALSLLAILLIQPRYLFQVGFQLSYAAIFSIVWIYPILVRWWNPRFWLFRKFWRLLAVSLAAQLGVLPLCLYYFHQFPGLFFISALILIPFLGILLGAGIVVIALATLDILPHIIALVYSYFIKSMNSIVQLISQQELFIFRGFSLDKTSLILLYLVLALLVLSLQWRRYRYVLLLGLAIISLQFHTLFRIHQNKKSQEVLLAHQVANSALLVQNAGELRIMASDTGRIESISRPMEMNRFLRITETTTMPAKFTLGRDQWIVLDSIGALPPVQGVLTGLILTHSPRIHLGRVLEQLCPERVIADGSNYPKEIRRWQQSCRAYGIPFYSTSENGALRL